MNRVLGMSFSVLVNVALLSGLALSDRSEHSAPAGEVYITELDGQQPEATNAWLFAETRA